MSFLTLSLISYYAHGGISPALWITLVYRKLYRKKNVYYSFHGVWIIVAEDLDKNELLHNVYVIQYITIIWCKALMFFVINKTLYCLSYTFHKKLNKEQCIFHSYERRLCIQYTESTVCILSLPYSYSKIFCVVSDAVLMLAWEAEVRSARVLSDTGSSPWKSLG